MCSLPDPELVAERRACFLATGRSVLIHACTALAELDMREQVTSLHLPALILAGSDDAATPPAMAEELAGLLPGAQFQLLSGLAHVPQLQDPDRFMTAIAGFLGC